MMSSVGSVPEVSREVIVSERAVQSNSDNAIHKRTWKYRLVITFHRNLSIYHKGDTAKKVELRRD